MSYQEDRSALHKRLDDFETRLAEKERAIAKRGAVPPHHRERIDEIYAKARATRAKLSNSQETTWESVKDEVEADAESLAANFEDWLERVDQDYR